MLSLITAYDLALEVRRGVEGTGLSHWIYRPETGIWVFVDGGYAGVIETTFSTKWGGLLGRLLAKGLQRSCRGVSELGGACHFIEVEEVGKLATKEGFVKPSEERFMVDARVQRALNKFVSRSAKTPVEPDVDIGVTLIELGQLLILIRPFRVALMGVTAPGREVLSPLEPTSDNRAVVVEKKEREPGGNNPLFSIKRVPVPYGWVAWGLHTLASTVVVLGVVAQIGLGVRSVIG